VVAGFIGCVVLFGAAYALGYVPDPMLSHGRGPGWECDSTRGGAVTCAKDVPVPIKPNSN
jgi:hypothetical protein